MYLLELFSEQLLKKAESQNLFILLIDLSGFTFGGCVFQVEDGILKLKNAGNEQDLGMQYKALKPEVDKLNIMAAKRQQVQA